MIEIKYIPKSKEIPTGRIWVEVSRDLDLIIKPEELPYRMVVRNGENIYWNSIIDPGTWTYYDPTDSSCCIEIINSLGFIIEKKFTSDFINGDMCQQFINYWSEKNPGAVGISIGTHDGGYGEWVDPVKNGFLKGLLVEPSEPQYSKLVENFGPLEGIKFIKEIITVDGKDCRFFETSQGYTNSIDLNFIEKFENGKTSRIVKTVSINDLIMENGLEKNIRWIIIDAENIDDKLIMSIDFEKIRKPDLIIFETFNFDVEEKKGINIGRKKIIFDWLKEKGYNVFDCHFNSLAVLDKWYEKCPPNEKNPPFDQVYCINLDERSDRWEDSKKEFEKVGIKNVNRFSATPGSNIKNLNSLSVRKKMACSISHLNVIKKAKLEGIGSVMILEDDVEFGSDFLVKLNSIFINEVPEDWDIVFIGGNHEGGIKMISQNVGKVTNSYALHCYLIKDSVYELLIKNYEMYIDFFSKRKTNDGKNVVSDVLMSKIQDSINCYAINPGLAWQRESYSDLQEKIVNYDNFLKVKW